MRKLASALAAVMVAAGCSGSSPERVETTPLDPAAAVVGAGTATQQQGTLRFRIVPDAETGQWEVTGSFSVDDGITYTQDAESLGMTSLPADINTDIVIRDGEMFVHSDLIYALGELAEARDPDLWVRGEIDSGAQEILDFFELLVGDLERVTGTEGVTVADLGDDRFGRHVQVTWTGTAPPIDDLTALDLWIGDDGRFVRALVAGGPDAEAVTIELFDHGQPVIIPSIVKTIDFDEVYDPPESVSEQPEPTRSVAGQSAELDEVLTLLGATGSSTVLVMVDRACGEECDAHLRTMDQAVRDQPNATALVVMITGEVTDEDLGRVADVVPSGIGPLVDADGQVAVALGAERFPITALLDADGGVETLVAGYLGDTIAAALVAEAS